VTRHGRQRLERRHRHGPEQDPIPPLLDGHFGAFETKLLGQANRLTPSVLEQLGRCNSYMV
jgi:hypothetical protein